MKNETRIKNHLKRILIGLAIGFAAGALYGLVSAHINLVLYPQFPLNYQPSKVITSVLQAALTVGVLGAVSSATPSSYQGVLTASVLGALGVVGAGIIGGSEQDILANLLLMVYGFLPLAVLFIPLSALLRWAANRLSDGDEAPLMSWPKLKGLVILLALSVLVGSFSAYPSEAQISLRRMQRYIESARQSATQDELPFAFSNVAPIVKNASAYYTLEWSDDFSAFPLGSGRESLAATPMAYAMVTARFESGESIACLFRSDGSVQLCALLR